jgi:hypothetical protein
LSPTTTTDEFGFFGDGQADPAWNVTIPATVAAGSYNLVITGQTSGTEGVSAFTMTPPPTSVKPTGPYGLDCPGTPLGEVVIAGVVTKGDISPASPAAGQSFSLTGYQTIANIPQHLAEAAGAIQVPPFSQPLAGTATTQIDAYGATPATTHQGPTNFSAPIPNPPPASGVALNIPDPAATVSGFTATSPNISIVEDASASLSLQVNGSTLTLTCTAFPASVIPASGVVGQQDANGNTIASPTGSPISPVIAVAGSGQSVPTPTTTTAPPTSPNNNGGSTSTSSSNLAFTGVGKGTMALGALAVLLIVMGIGMLILVDAPRRAMLRLRLATVHPRHRTTRRPPGTALVPQRRSSIDWHAPMDAMGDTMHSMTDRVADMGAAGAEFVHETAQSARRGVARMTSWLLGR